MGTVSIRELSRHASGVVHRVAESGRPEIVTMRGEPVAAVVPLDREALEDFILANAPSFVRAMHEADAALLKRETRSAAELFEELESGS